MVLDKVKNMDFHHPKGFIGDSVGFYCSDITGYACLKGSLKSDDGTFVVFFDIFNPREISLELEDGSIKRYMDANMLDIEHVYLINSVVKRSFGEDAVWKDYVHYYASDDAKTIFNADTVLSISFLINKDECFFSGNEYDKNNFTHSTVLIIQKKGHGFVVLHCLYDENKKNKDAYMAAIGGVLKFRKGKPELERYEEDDDEIIILSRPKQEKRPKI
jgi:hypothetical protein